MLLAGVFQSSYRCFVSQVPTMCTLSHELTTNSVAIVQMARLEIKSHDPCVVMEASPPHTGVSAIFPCVVLLLSWARFFHSSTILQAIRFERIHARTHSQKAQSWDSAQVCVTPRSVVVLLLFSARILEIESTLTPFCHKPFSKNLMWDPVVKSR